MSNNEIEKVQELQELRIGIKHPENMNECWTDEDTKKLLEMFDEGVGISDIALKLDRNEPSVCSRLQKIGRFEPQTQPRQSRTKDLECKCRECKNKDCQNCGKNNFQGKTEKTI